MRTRPPPVAGRVPLVGFYLLYFGTVGITLPFLPAYLASLSLSVAQVGVLLSLQPLLALLAPPLWGHLADRTGRPDRVLQGLACGALVGASALLWAERFGGLALALALYALFASSITSLADSLALQRVAAVGGSYAHLRLFGSLGFVLSSVAFGLASSGPPGRATLHAALALITGYALWSFTLHAQGAPSLARSPIAGLALLADRDIRRLLAAACLHWVACAPFHGTFAIHVGALGLPTWVVGVSAGLGVVAEMGVMLLHPRLARRLSARLLLCAAFGASAARWAGMALASSAPLLITLSLLHGMTFGAFYVASVGFMAERAPPALRASAQALFVSVTFGLGGLLGYASAGVGYDVLGGHRLFAAAAGLELVAAGLVLGLAPRPAATAP